MLRGLAGDTKEEYGETDPGKETSEQNRAISTKSSISPCITIIIYTDKHRVVLGFREVLCASRRFGPLSEFVLASLENDTISYLSREASYHVII